MADALLANYLLGKKGGNRSEGFSASSPSSDSGRDGEGRREASKGARALSVVWMAVWTLLFGVPAFVLSWTSNAQAGWHWSVRAVFGSLAFLFGFLYLLIHLIHKLDLVLAIRGLKAAAAAAAATAAPLSSVG